ncbi:MAG: DUF294 nucleotidyltransferase-like domain-containing protein [Pirellulaceae bacterium]
MPIRETDQVAAVPPVFPAEREAALDLAPYAAIDTAWRTSRETFAALRDARGVGDLTAEIRCLAISGSLGRMEQTRRSDVDLIVVLHDNCNDDRAAEVYAEVWSRLSAVGLPPPKTRGIFSTPTSQMQLCSAAALGKVDEDRAVFGKRIQLLLDAQPLWGEEAFTSLQRVILERYGQDDALRHGDGQWTYLQRDLIRYFQSMAIDCRQRDRGKPGVWRIRNLKLQHSRRLMIGALLLLLGESTSRGRTDLDGLLSRLSFTPLERIAAIYAACDDDGFTTIAAHYEQFAAGMLDDDVRRRLAAPLSDGGPPDACEDYQRLSRNGQQLAGELWRFLLARRGDWSDRFFQTLLF